ncbi:hypothetical protein BB561_005054 [Smittium simulii]|uniref:Uncharacterized protein n=1 Tax=Smittium simulii TaxID=133385 RepID=A0A2T9YCJ1_9FUNG|nr:hypothetical protein BB561_005054 [Smittium simulii]
MISTSNTSGSFGQKLAHVDKQVRDAAIEKLGRFFAAKEAFYEQDFLKLWKAIYYFQQTLAEDLGKLSFKLKKESSMLYFQTFWQTMNREWSMIDRHRVNKYYMLMRKMFYYNLLALENCDFDKTTITSYHHMMRSFPLNPVSSKFSDGIRAHLGEICLSEVLKLLEFSKKTVPIALIIEPFIEFTINTPNINLFKIFKEDVLEFPILAINTFNEDPANTLTDSQLPLMKEISKVITQVLTIILADCKIHDDAVYELTEIVENYKLLFVNMGMDPTDILNDGMSDKELYRKFIKLNTKKTSSDAVSGFKSEEAVIMKQVPPQSSKKDTSSDKFEKKTGNELSNSKKKIKNDDLSRNGNNDSKKMRTTDDKSSTKTKGNQSIIPELVKINKKSNKTTQNNSKNGNSEQTKVEKKKKDLNKVNIETITKVEKKDLNKVNIENITKVEKKDLNKVNIEKNKKRERTHDKEETPQVNETAVISKNSIEFTDKQKSNKGIKKLSNMTDDNSSTPTGVQKKFKWALENNSTKRFIKQKPITPLRSEMDLDATPVRSALKKTNGYESNSNSTPTNVKSKQVKQSSASKFTITQNQNNKENNFVLGNVKSNK